MLKTQVKQSESGEKSNKWTERWTPEGFFHDYISDAYVTTVDLIITTIWLRAWCLLYSDGGTFSTVMMTEEAALAERSEGNSTKCSLKAPITQIWNN